VTARFLKARQHSEISPKAGYIGYEQFLNLLVSMIMPQNWAAVPNENPDRLYSFKVGGVAPAFLFLSAAISAASPPISTMSA